MSNNKVTRRGNGEGSIILQKDGRWRAQLQIGVKPNGKADIKCFYSSKNKKEALQKLNDYKTTNSLLSSKEYSNLYLDKYINYWFGQKLLEDIKPATLDRLESTINTHIIPHVGKYKLNALKPEYIKTYVIDRMYKDGLSYSSIKKAYEALNACMKYALLKRHIVVNPMAEVALPKQSNFEVKKVRSLDEAEINKLKEVAICVCSKNGSPKYNLGYGILFILNTGLRLGEVLDLKWSDVNFDKKEVKVDSSCTTAKNRSDGDKKGRVQQSVLPKTKNSKRVIPLNQNAITYLNKLKKIRYFGEDTYILSTRDSKQTNESNFRRMFNEILTKAGIEHCGVHTLRHTFATQMFLKGIDVKTISTILGHSSVQITYDTYIDVFKETQAQAIQLVNI